VPAGGTDPLGNPNPTTSNFIPFNKKSVITGNPNQWFNPLMFALQPTYYQGTTVPGVGTFPAIPGCTTGNGGCYYGQLGNTGRDTLRGPGFGSWNFSIVKDTAIHALGVLHRGATAWAAWGTAPCPLPDRADYLVCGWNGARMTTSSLRFCALPSGVLLLATGWNSA
jgi:hypothetical protein